VFLERGDVNGVDGVVRWFSLEDGHLSVIVPISAIVAVVLVIIIVVCVVCRRRPCASKPGLPPPAQPQRACTAPTTSSMSTTTYLPSSNAPTAANGLDEYTRCFVATRAVDRGTSAALPVGNTHSGMAPATASSSPRQPLMSAAPALRSDVKYRFYEEC